MNSYRLYPHFEEEKMKGQKNKTQSIKLRVSPSFRALLRARADMFTNGNISELIRYAVMNVRHAPKKKAGK
jgi:uncharacterized protein (DUF1778 family)